MTTSQQVQLGPEYLEEKEESILQKIVARRRQLGARLLILSHHYQQEKVFQQADLVGDSLKLAKGAAEARDSSFIVFCGVHFMAESADILTADDQAVILPDLSAGCSMADMATRAEVEGAWSELTSAVPAQLVPITYVNSSASLKALVGEKGGSVCTSANAERVLAWALQRGDKVFFFPDEHLGRNSAHALGIPAAEVVLWERGLPLGGNSLAQLQKAKVILWDGYCTVHMQFSAAQVAAVRREDPEVKVIVHPECRQEVVLLADHYGSTEAIIKAVASSPAGSSWAVGTEVNLVARLANQFPDKRIRSLSPMQCLCSTMYRIDPAHLLWVLDNLAENRVVNQIVVDRQTAALAKLALDRMLEI